MQFQARASLVLVMCASLSAACSAEERRPVSVPPVGDAGEPYMRPPPPPPVGCVDVEIEGDVLTEHLEDFTANFQVGAAYERTVMLFGGMQITKANTPTRAYIFGLDKVDAQMMAKKYPDFYLCSSVGGQEAASFIEVYDIIPANCKVYQQLTAALGVFNRNASAGGDRTSLHLQGAPLTVTSVIADATGEDVKDQVSDQQFHLITGVQQLTGESLLNFGTTE